MPLIPHVTRGNQPYPPALVCSFFLREHPTVIMANLLRDYPELRTFQLQNVRLTGTRIGSGAYGSVEEGEIPGAICAIKKIHDIFQDLTEIPQAEMERAAGQFVEECRLMTTLRHPHVVLFLGICVLPGSRLPALVMERLLTSLHDLLETRPNIPLGLKHSFLYDVAQGLCYLHSHSPPLIHRDLSARNVLLNSAMTAKIGDLGVARIVPSLRVATMTKAPGASIYMPPEALGDESRYDMTIDIFSLGVVAIFTLTQCFPHKVLAQVYQDQHDKVVVRNELERRAEYMQQIYSQFCDDHPLVQMIKQCLGSFPKNRPSIHQVVQLLERARGEINDAECHMDRLVLVQTVKKQNQQILSVTQENQSLKAENEQLREQVLVSEQVLLWAVYMIILYVVVWYIKGSGRRRKGEEVWEGGREGQEGKKGRQRGEMENESGREGGWERGSGREE